MTVHQRVATIILEVPQLQKLLTLEN